MQDNFFEDIKPYIHILSLYKREQNIGSDGGKYLSELGNIHKKYISPICPSCKPFTMLKGLIKYYEQTPKKGRKKEL